MVMMMMLLRCEMDGDGKLVGSESVQIKKEKEVEKKGKERD